MKANPKMAANTLIQFFKLFKTYRFHNLSIHCDGMSSRMTKVKLIDFLDFHIGPKYWAQGHHPFLQVLGHIFPNFCFSRSRREAENCRVNVLYSLKYAPRSLLSNAHRFSIIGQIIKKGGGVSQVVQVFSHIPPFLAWL